MICLFHNTARSIDKVRVLFYNKYVTLQIILYNFGKKRRLWVGAFRPKPESKKRQKLYKSVRLLYISEDYIVVKLFCILFFQEKYALWFIFLGR